MATSCAVNDKSAVVAEALSKYSNGSISVSIASKLITRAVKDGLLKQEDVRPDKLTSVVYKLYDMTAKRVPEDRSLSVNRNALKDAEREQKPRGWSSSLSYGNAFIGNAGDSKFLLAHGYTDVSADDSLVSADTVAIINPTSFSFSAPPEALAARALAVLRAGGRVLSREEQDMAEPFDGMWSVIEKSMRDAGAFPFEVRPVLDDDGLDIVDSYPSTTHSWRIPAKVENLDENSLKIANLAIGIGRALGRTEGNEEATDEANAVQLNPVETGSNEGTIADAANTMTWGGAIEVKDVDEQDSDHLARAFSIANERKSEFLAPSEKASIAENLSSAGKENDANAFFNQNHKSTTGETAETGSLAEAFNGDYALVNQFSKSVSVYFREACEQSVIPAAIEEMTERAATLRSKLDSGRMSNHAANKARSELVTIEDQLATLKDDGWLGAVRIPELMNRTLISVTNDFGTAQIIANFISKKKKELNTNDFQTLANEVYEEYEIDGSLDDMPCFKLILADLNSPFLNKLYAGYDRDTDAEARQRLEDEGDAEGLAAMDARGADELDAVKRADEDILSQRKLSDKRRREMYERMCVELSAATGVNFNLDSVDKHNKKKSESKDAQSDDSDDANNENDEDEDVEKQENEGRDIQFVNPNQRSVSSTVGAEVRRILASLPEYSYDVKDGEWYAKTDPVFGLPRMLPGSFTFNHLLSTFSSQNNDKGLRDGDEVYEFLKSKEKVVGWYHGLVERMDADPSLRTALYVTFFKTRLNMRSFHIKTGDAFSMTENYDEDAYNVVASIQERMTKGLVLDRGEAGRGLTFIMNPTRHTVKYPVDVSDISIYGPDGKWNPGTLKHDGRDIDWRKVRDQKLLGKATGSYGFSAFVYSFFEKTGSGYRGPNAMPDDASDLTLKDKANIVRALRAAGLDCDVEMLNAQLAMDEIPFSEERPEVQRKSHYKGILDGLRSIAQSVDPIFKGDPDKVRVDRKNGGLFDQLRDEYNRLCYHLTAMSANGTEMSYSWGDKQYYSYSDRSFLDEVVFNLGDEEDDAAVARYIEKEYLHMNDADASFYTDRRKGKERILNGMLRDLLPNSSSSTEEDISSCMRVALHRGRYGNLGIIDSTGDEFDKPGDKVIEYGKMTVPQKMSVELSAFLRPMGGNNKNIYWTMSEYGRGPIPRVAQYSVPIMADSGNHIFVGARVFHDVDSTAEDGLLDRFADLVIAETQRMTIYKSNTIKGEPLLRATMPKTLGKRAGQYCTFPGMNEMRAVVGGEKMSFFDAMALLMSDDGGAGEVTLLPGEENGPVALKDDDGTPMERKLAMAASLLCLNDFFARDLKYWRTKGVFDVDVNADGRLLYLDDINDRLYDEEGLLSHARKQFILRSKTARDILDDERIRSGLSQESIALLQEMTDPLYLVDLYTLSGARRVEAVNRHEAAMKKLASEVAQSPGGEKYGEDFKHKEKGDYFSLYNNLLLQVMREYSFNRSCFKAQFLGLLVGDIAQFKGEGDLSKRMKSIVARYEHCDLTAVDLRNGGRRCLDYYGEEKVRDWDAHYQKTITLKDFEARRNPDGTIGGFHGISQFFNKQLLPKLSQDLEAGVITRQEYADICSAYAGMNISDGQSFRTMESMKKMYDMLHMSSDSFERIYKAVVVERRKLRYDEVRDYCLQMKTVSLDFHTVDVPYSEQGPLNEEERKTYAQRLCDFVKDSQYTLMLYSEEMSKHMGKDSVMEGILRFASKNQVDVIHFDSTKKTGEMNEVDVTNAKNGTEAERMLQEAYDAGVSDPSKDIRHKEAWSRVGKQIPTKEHLIDKTQGIGTQIDKLIEVDMEDTWEHPGPDGKKVKSPTVVKMRDAEGNVIARFTPSEYNEKLNRLKIANMRDNLLELEKRFGDKEKLSQMLVETINATGKYTDNVLEAVKIDPKTGDFNVPLDNPAVVDAVASVVASAVRKRVVKQKTCGGTSVQFSSVGRSDALKTVWGIDEETGQPYIKYCEAMLPAWSKGLFKAYAKPDGTIDINDVPVELRTMVGYRVPTEHLYSIIPIRIVGFLPDAGGSSIMLPQEIVVWSGSDFDIDKLYLEIPEFKVHEGGKLKVERAEVQRQFLRANPELRRNIEERWVNLLSEELEANPDMPAARRERMEIMLRYPSEVPFEAWADYSRSRSTGVNKGAGDVFDVLDDKERDDVEMDMDAFAEREGLLTETTVDLCNGLRPDCTQEEIDAATPAERNNLLIKLHYARLTSDFSCLDCARAGGFTQQKKMARIISILSNTEGTFTYADLASRDLEDSNGVEGLDSLAEKYGVNIDMAQASSDDQLFERNMVGAQLIGIYALHNAFHAVIQKAPVTLSDEFMSRFSFRINGKPMPRTLGSVRDIDGNSITRNIAGFLAASVDNAKDPVLADLTQSPITADLTLAMLHMGYPIGTVTMMMSQPDVKRLADASTSSTGFQRQIEIWCESLNVDVTSIDITDEDLAEGLHKSTSDSFQSSETFADSVMLVLNAMGKISNRIRAAMDAAKITSPDKNMQNTLGETMKCMSPIEDLDASNLVEERDGKGKLLSSYYVFDRESFRKLVMPRHEKGGKEPARVDDFFSADDQSDTPRLPYVQACYDYGLDRPAVLMSGILGSFGVAARDAVMKLNSMRIDGKKGILNPQLIDSLIKERKRFASIKEALSEDMRPGDTISEIRRAYLTSFPEYFTNLMIEDTDDHRKRGKFDNARYKSDWASEFAILRHIVKEKRRPGTKIGQVYDNGNSMDVLVLSKGGKANKTIVNEYVSSWDKMARDERPEVRNLAMQLYKYSLLYDGFFGFGKYVPASVLKSYGGFNKAIVASASSMGESQEARFLDQFVRNHVNELTGMVVHSITLKPNDSLTDLAYHLEWRTFAKSDDDGNETLNVYVPNQQFITTMYGKAAKASYLFLKVKANNKINTEALYRREPYGKSFIYRKCDELGSFGMTEYDPDSDLNNSTMIGDMSFDFFTQLNWNRNSLKDAIQLNERVQRQTAILDDLEQSLNFIKYKDKSDGAGNDSKAYLVGVEGKEAERVHTWMAELGYGEIKKPNKYTDEQWATAKEVGTSIGSAIDNYTRLYLNRTNGVLSAEEQSEMKSIFAPDGELASKGIKFKLNNDATPEQALDRSLHDAIESLKKEPGDKVMTQLGGKNIVVWGDVDTKLGHRTIGGELDVLVAHADGTFTIADLKNVKSTSLPYILRDVGVPTPGGTYAQYCTQLNSYRSLLLSRYPDMEINRLCIVPIVTERTIVDRNDAPINFAVPDRSKGEQVIVNGMSLMNNVGQNGICKRLIEVPINPSFCGINGPQTTETEENVEQETVKATEDTKQEMEKEGVSPDGFSSFREIFIKFLGEEKADRFKTIAENMDGIFTEEELEEMKEDGVTVEEEVENSYNHLMAIKSEKEMRQSAEAGMKLSAGRNFLERKLLELNVKQDIIEKLSETIKAHKRIKGDDGIELC